MAFNPRDTRPKLKDVSGLPMVSGKRTEYYIEWWKIGTEHNMIETGNFHVVNLKSFIKTFVALKKYTVVYLERVNDNRVVIDRRSTVQ